MNFQALLAFHTEDDHNPPGAVTLFTCVVYLLASHKATQYQILVTFTCFFFFFKHILQFNHCDKPSSSCFVSRVRTKLNISTKRLIYGCDLYSCCSYSTFCTAGRETVLVIIKPQRHNVFFVQCSEIKSNILL